MYYTIMSLAIFGTVWYFQFYSNHVIAMLNMQSEWIDSKFKLSQKESWLGGFLLGSQFPIAITVLMQMWFLEGWIHD